jgi:hypothetical protein
VTILLFTASKAGQPQRLVLGLVLLPEEPHGVVMRPGRSLFLRESWVFATGRERREGQRPLGLLTSLVGQGGMGYAPQFITKSKGGGQADCRIVSCVQSRVAEGKLFIVWTIATIVAQRRLSRIGMAAQKTCRAGRVTVAVNWEPRSAGGA